MDDETARGRATNSTVAGPSCEMDIFLIFHFSVSFLSPLNKGVILLGKGFLCILGLLPKFTNSSTQCVSTFPHVLGFSIPEHES